VFVVFDFTDKYFSVREGCIFNCQFLIVYHLILSKQLLKVLKKSILSL